MELDLKSVHEGDLCVVSAVGELDVYSAPRLKDELVAEIESGCDRIVIDLSAVTFIDSSGLGVLVSALRRTREREGVLRIVCDRETVLRIFRITGLDKVFSIFATLEQARSF